MSRPGKTILIVDDEFALALALEMVLGNAGYRVAVAFNGKEGALGVLKIKPDLIVLDLMMPFMSGLELLTLIRSRPSTRKVPVILTGEIAPKEAREKYGWNLWLAKPFQFAQMTEAIFQLIGPAH